jgi:hypothetical protein
VQICAGGAASLSRSSRRLPSPRHLCACYRECSSRASLRLRSCLNLPSMLSSLFDEKARCLLLRLFFSCHLALEVLLDLLALASCAAEEACGGPAEVLEGCFAPRL